MLRSKIKFTADLHALISRKLLDDIGHVELVMSKFQRIDLKRNEQLLNEGDVCKHVYFITQGCLQAYVYGTKMLESTKKIVTFCRLFFSCIYRNLSSQIIPHAKVYFSVR